MKFNEASLTYSLEGGATLYFREPLTTSGTTNEDVIEVLLHRIRRLDKRLPCRENALAITKLEEALHWLQARTAKRVAQGVVNTENPHVS